MSALAFAPESRPQCGALVHGQPESLEIPIIINMWCASCGPEDRDREVCLSTPVFGTSLTRPGRRRVIGFFASGLKACGTKQPVNH
jgi:hypothetical protein